MSTLAKGLVALSALAFVLAVFSGSSTPLGVGAEGFSRASSNLALIAIALFVGMEEKGPA